MKNINVIEKDFINVPRARQKATFTKLVKTCLGMQWIKVLDRSGRPVTDIAHKGLFR